MGSQASVHPIDLFDGEDEDVADIVRNNEILEDDILSHLSSSDVDSAMEHSTTKSIKHSKLASSSKKAPDFFTKVRVSIKSGKITSCSCFRNQLIYRSRKGSGTQYHEAMKAQNEAKLTMEKEWKEKELGQQQSWREKQIRWKDVEI
jgi:hypothetical protein